LTQARVKSDLRFLRNRDSLKVTTVYGRNSKTGSTIGIVAHSPVAEGIPVQVVVALSSRLPIDSVDVGEESFGETKTGWTIHAGVGGVLVGVCGHEALLTDDPTEVVSQSREM
jgi:hypothetical protein